MAQQDGRAHGAETRRQVPHRHANHGRGASPGGGAGDRLPQHTQEPPMRLERQGETGGTCPSCRRDGLQLMGFQLKDGNTAQMRRCGRCEWKSWWLDGRQVALAELLTVVQETGLPRAKRSSGKPR